MKSITKAICALAVIATLAMAADKPNFSGEWKMNLAKSMLGPMPAPTSFTRKVTHAEPSLTIADDQKGGAGDLSYTRQYTTDGKEIAYQANGADVKGGATWDGDAIVIRSQAKVGELDLVITDKITLTDGGKTLSDVVHIELPQGAFDLTYVFDKQ